MEKMWNPKRFHGPCEEKRVGSGENRRTFIRFSHAAKVRTQMLRVKSKC